MDLADIQRCRRKFPTSRHSLSRIRSERKIKLSELSFRLPFQARKMPNKCVGCKIWLLYKLKNIFLFFFFFFCSHWCGCFSGSSQILMNIYARGASLSINIYSHQIYMFLILSNGWFFFFVSVYTYLWRSLNDTKVSATFLLYFIYILRPYKTQN